MARTFARDDVLRLAPDAGSAKSGQELAQPRKWINLGADEVVIWGECQGSGSKPYQVQVDLSEPAFKCSCPSRKFPCKHGLGLLLIYAASPAALTPTQRPTWVSQWLDSRQARAAKADKPLGTDGPPRDPEAQAKRLAQRLERARSGMRDLAAWMQDLVRSGIATAPTKGFDFFDSQARRMVDAQAPGVARRVRQLGSLSASGSGWQQPFVEHLARLHLIAKAVAGFDRLPEPVQADVHAALGIAMASDDLTGLPAVRDQWQIIAQETETEDRLRAQRSWLFGVQSRRTAMVLHFAYGGAAVDSSLSPGTQFDAELVFFPGGGLRAAVRSPQPTVEPLEQLHGYDCLDAALEGYSTVIASLPWIDRLCLPLQGVTPSVQGDDWWAIDSTGAGLPMRVRGTVGFTLLAVSGGLPIDLAAEFDGRVLRPMATSAEGRWVSLSESVEGES